MPEGLEAATGLFQRVHDIAFATGWLRLDDAVRYRVLLVDVPRWVATMMDLGPYVAGSPAATLTADSDPAHGPVRGAAVRVGPDRRRDGAPYGFPGADHRASRVRLHPFDGVGEGVLVTAAPPTGWDRAAYRACCDAETVAAPGDDRACCPRVWSQFGSFW